MPTDPKSYIYIKFDGPAADLGNLDIAKAGKALSALSRWNKHYKKELLHDKIDYTLKIDGVQKNCTEIQIIVEFAERLINDTPVVPLATAAGILKLPGVNDFVKGFGNELGKQLAIKVFANGKRLKESDPYHKNGKVVVKAINSENKAIEVTKQQLDFYRKSSTSLGGMYALEAGKEDRLRVGYHTKNDGSVDTGELLAGNKTSFFEDIDPDILAKRMAESFEDELATDEKVEGQFVDFHGLAHKYKFSFQVRKRQEEYGKQKILCIVDDTSISEILDLLKPENKKNVCIKGRATRDQEGKLDKIKIDWFNVDANYNPDQTTLLN